MMEMEFSLSEIGIAAREFLACNPHRVVLFEGEMGAGKTTFIKAVSRELGVDDNTSSPTFSLVNEYHGTPGRIFHFDVYRLKSQTEALDMGIEEYLYSGDWCFIEWPGQIPDLIPERHTVAHLSVAADGRRKLSITNIG